MRLSGFMQCMTKCIRCLNLWCSQNAKYHCSRSDGNVKLLVLVVAITDPFDCGLHTKDKRWECLLVYMSVCCTLADACVGPTRWVCRRFSSNVEDGASQSVQVYCVSLNSFTQYVYKASQDFPTPVGRIPHLWTRTRELRIYCVSVSGLSWCHLHQV